MKDLYYKMKAWFVVKKMEKLEDNAVINDPLQNTYDNEGSELNDNHNSLE